jgi:hypothetical protein
VRPFDGTTPPDSEPTKSQDPGSGHGGYPPGFVIPRGPLPHPTPTADRSRRDIDMMTFNAAALVASLGMVSGPETIPPAEQPEAALSEAGKVTRDPERAAQLSACNRQDHRFEVGHCAVHPSNFLSIENCFRGVVGGAMLDQRHDGGPGPMRGGADAFAARAAVRHRPRGRRITVP